MNLTLRQLRYFDALARHGHFGRAAEVCAISQPALSVQIQQMEDTMGAALFERSARQVRLTGLGENLAPRIRDILDSVEALGELARAGDDTMPGRLRLGIIPTIAPYILPRLIQRLSDQHPETDLHVRESLTETLIAELDAGRIDAALVALPISEPAFHEESLTTEEFVLVRPRFEANLPVPDAEGLRRMRLLLLEEGHCFRDQALSFCKLPTSMLHEGLESSSLTTLVQMVAAGMGVTLIPDMAVDVETAAAPVATTRFRAPAPERTLGMIWRKSTPLAKQMKGVAALVRAVLQNTPA